MSSFPASPTPPRQRESRRGRGIRSALSLRADARGVQAKPGASRPTANAGQRTAPPDWAPLPAALIRVPYREWKGPRPRVVSLSAALIVLGGIITLVGGIAATRTPVPELSSTAAQLERLGVDVTRYAAVFQGLALATALVVFGLYLLFAFLIREGRNWARIGGTVLVGPALVAALVHGEVAQVFATAAAAAGLALLYRRDCNRYFRPPHSRYRGGG